MGYFDGLVDVSFKTDATGKTLFYPWGARSSGYAIDSDAKKNDIRKLYKIYYMTAIPAVIIAQLFISFWLSVALLPLFIVWYALLTKKVTKDLHKTDEQLKTSEALANSARSHNLFMLIFLELIALGFVALGLWSIYSGHGAPIAYAGIVFFGLCAVPIGYMIVIKIKNKKCT